MTTEFGLIITLSPTITGPPITDPGPMTTLSPMIGSLFYLF